MKRSIIGSDNALNRPINKKLLIRLGILLFYECMFNKKTFSFSFYCLKQHIKTVNISHSMSKSKYKYVYFSAE